MMYRPRDKNELLAMLAGIINNIPEEFIDFDDIDIDLSHEFTVDGSDEDDWYPGAKVRFHESGQMIIVIPLERKASVYAYYADRFDAEIEEQERVVEDLKRLKEIYSALGRSDLSE